MPMTASPWAQNVIADWQRFGAERRRSMDQPSPDYKRYLDKMKAMKAQGQPILDRWATAASRPSISPQAPGSTLQNTLPGGRRSMGYAADPGLGTQWLATPGAGQSHISQPNLGSFANVPIRTESWWKQPTDNIASDWNFTGSYHPQGLSLARRDHFGLDATPGTMMDGSPFSATAAARAGAANQGEDALKRFNTHMNYGKPLMASPEQRQSMVFNRAFNQGAARHQRLGIDPGLNPQQSAWSIAQDPSSLEAGVGAGMLPWQVIASRDAATARNNTIQESNRNKAADRQMEMAIAALQAGNPGLVQAILSPQGDGDTPQTMPVKGSDDKIPIDKLKRNSKTGQIEGPGGRKYTEFPNVDGTVTLVPVKTPRSLGSKIMLGPDTTRPTFTTIPRAAKDKMPPARKKEVEALEKRAKQIQEDSDNSSNFFEWGWNRLSPWGTGFYADGTRR